MTCTRSVVVSQWTTGNCQSLGIPSQPSVSDAGATLLAEALGRPITLADYRNPAYPKSLTDTLAVEPRMRTLLWQSAVKGLTTSQDALSWQATVTPPDPS